MTNSPFLVRQQSVVKIPFGMKLRIDWEVLVL
jgi:hypothetical protein